MANGAFWCQLITYAKSLDTDQDQQSVSPDLDPNHFELYHSASDRGFEKVYFEKKNQQTTKHGNLPSMQKVKKGHFLNKYKKTTKIACIELMEYG